MSNRIQSTPTDDAETEYVAIHESDRFFIKVPVRPSRPSRRELLARARTGDATAQLDVAEDYDFHPPKDRHRAVYWYRKAAKQGLPQAQNSLGECLRAGDGVRRSLKGAAVWFRKAAEQGDASACLSLGYALFNGKGVRQDRQEALFWYRRAARGRNDSMEGRDVAQRAQCNIAHMYRCGEGVPQSWNRAIHWYEKAADGGHLTAMYWLGRIYGGEEDYRGDTQTAVYWLTLAAESGDAGSQCSLGIRFINGDGVERDSKLGASWYRKAAEQGDGWACYLLGLCYRDGTGVRRNSQCARHWLARAATMGVKEARSELKRMRQW